MRARSPSAGLLVAVGLGGQEQAVYYAGVTRLPVHAAPAPSSKVVGWLALHERVTRSRVEGGYARISATDRGLSGWVDNAHLLWRLPAAGAAPSSPAPEPVEARDVAPEPAPVPDPVPASAPEPAPVAEPASAPAEPPPAADPPPPAHRPRPRAFDPF